MYTFGVILLELITRRKPVDVSQLVGEESLIEWVSVYLYICQLVAFSL